MSDDCIKEIIQLLKKELDQLKPNLVSKVKEEDKTKKTFSELLFVSFPKNLFKPLSEKLLRRKLRGLKREIPALEEKIEHYEQGVIDLQQGIYGSAMPLLEELEFIACLGSIRGTRCREILKLIEQFAALSSNPCVL